MKEIAFVPKSAKLMTDGLEKIRVCKSFIRDLLGSVAAILDDISHTVYMDRQVQNMNYKVLSVW